VSPIARDVPGSLANLESFQPGEVQPAVRERALAGVRRQPRPIRGMPRWVSRVLHQTWSVLSTALLLVLGFIFLTLEFLFSIAKRCILLIAIPLRRMWRVQQRALERARIFRRLKKNDPTFTELNFSGKNISDSHVIALANMLKVNTKLTKLRIDNNNICAEGAFAFAESLTVNLKLAELYLIFNNIGATGAAALAEALTVNQTLKVLGASFNVIGDDGATAFAVALSVNTTLRTLLIASNDIGDTGASALAEALKVNKTLTTLHVENFRISDAFKIALRLSARAGCRVDV
jgi:Leucine Rich repeat